MAQVVDTRRASVRAAAVPLTHAFREHRAVCDDAWRDLRHHFGELQSEASNDCWNIDGPHLDGRFPTEAQQGEGVARESKQDEGKG